MLARLLLALLVALLPMPAAAAGGACHESPPAVTATESHHGQTRAPAPADLPAAEQFCLGCVAPSTLRAPVLGAPLAHAREIRTARLHTGLARADWPPATPPPRFEA